MTERVARKAGLCPTGEQNVSIDRTVIGYGCTRQEATDQFFARILDKIDDAVACAGKECREKGRMCAPEMIDNPDTLQNQLQYRRVRLQSCQGAGWKCFLFASNQQQTQNVRGTCTCVPQAM